MVSIRLLIGTALFTISAAQRVSNTGRCGATYGLTCAGSSFGRCCSSNGWCGSTSDYCGQGCKTGFGTCGSNTPAPSSKPTTKPVSKDERCGSQYKGQTCQGSAFGNCCSQYGYCGRSSAYCAATSCQKDFGTCNGGQAPGNTLSTVVVPSSSRNAQPTADPSTVTITISAAAPTCPPRTTVTLPAEAGDVITVTIPTTIAGDSTTITLETTLTIPGAGEVITVTIPTTVASTITETPLPASTVTITTTASPTSPGGFQCSATSGFNVVSNPGFESVLSGNWVTFISSADDNVERVLGVGADGSAYYFRARTGATSDNLSQRLVQAVSLCPGTTYQLTFMARRVTSVGSISVTGYVGVPGSAPSPLAGGAITSSTFTSVPSISGGTIMVPSGNAPVSGLLYLEFTYSGGFNAVKEVSIDNVNLVVV